MYPVLFHLGNIPVHSYYVLWTVALCIAVEWTKRRAVHRYRMEEKLVVDVLLWSFLGMMLGARLGGYVDHWRVYAEDPARLLRIWEGAMSSTTAFMGAGLVAMWRLRRAYSPIWPLAEAASLPAAAMLSVGRLGCFFNGCCYGKVCDQPWAVHFPRDPAGLFRHPTQLYYSLGALVILAILWFVEYLYPPVDRKMRNSALVWPLFMVLYGGLRFFVDYLRAGDRVAGLRLAQIMGILIVSWGLLWLLSGICHRQNSSDRDMTH